MQIKNNTVRTPEKPNEAFVVGQSFHKKPLNFFNPLTRLTHLKHLSPHLRKEVTQKVAHLLHDLHVMEQPKADGVTSMFQEKFGKLATNKKDFYKTMTEIFGNKYDKTKLEMLRQKALKGDFSWLPKVEYVDSKTLGGAHGAYSADTETVYINKDLDPKTAAKTFLEEAGHHVDHLINKQDAVGDEGEMFRRVLSGEKLSAAQKNEIRADNDHGTIEVNGKKVNVEFWGGFFKKIGHAISHAAKKVGHALGGAAKKVGHAVKNVVNHVKHAISEEIRLIKKTGHLLLGSVKKLLHNIGKEIVKLGRKAGKLLLKELIKFAKTPVGHFIVSKLMHIAGPLTKYLDKKVGYPKLNKEIRSKLEKSHSFTSKQIDGFIKEIDKKVAQKLAAKNKYLIEEAFYNKAGLEKIAMEAASEVITPYIQKEMHTKIMNQLDGFDLTNKEKTVLADKIEDRVASKIAAQQTTLFDLVRIKGEKALLAITTEAANEVVEQELLNKINTQLVDSLKGQVDPGTESTYADEITDKVKGDISGKVTTMSQKKINDIVTKRTNEVVNPIILKKIDDSLTVSLQHQVPPGTESAYADEITSRVDKATNGQLPSMSKAKIDAVVKAKTQEVLLSGWKPATK